MDVRTKWNGRDRTVKAEFVLKEETIQNHWGVTLFGFWMPNIYGSPNGSVTFYLQESARFELKLAFEALLEDGCAILLTEAHRSYEKQAQAYKDKPGLAVSPDVSKHPRGLAIDAWLFDEEIGVWVADDKSTYGDQDMLADYLAFNSWERTVMPKEPWHFDFKG